MYMYMYIYIYIYIYIYTSLSLYVYIYIYIYTDHIFAGGRRLMRSPTAWWEGRVVFVGNPQKTITQPPTPRRLKFHFNRIAPTRAVLSEAIKGSLILEMTP